MLVANSIAPASVVPVTYAQTVLGTTGLVSYWQCNESSGTTVHDSKGTNNLTLSGGFTLGSSGIGDGQTAIAFNGSTGQATGIQSGTLSGAWSVELWINSASNAANGIFGTRNGANSFDIQFSGTTTVHADIGTGSAWLSTAADGVTAASLSTWYYIVYAVTATGYTVYRNGASNASGSWASSTPLLWDASHNPFIGQNGTSAQFFNGTIAHVAVYNIALASGTISSHWTSVATGVASTSTGTVARAIARSSQI